MIGRPVGSFRIVEHLGSGGMGIVYRAHDERLKRDVALKFLGPGRLLNDLSRTRFQREALALSRLNHPAITTVHEFVTEQGSDILVMEFIPGQDLHEHIAGKPLPEGEALRLGAQLADGLAAAHRAGLVHRDLKPRNLRVTSDGRLKILDFGVARWLDRGNAADTVTASQEVVGTVPYMAPEQLRGETADARADVYAAGAVLYEMVTGSRIFPDLVGPPLVHAILNLEPPAPRHLNPALSPEFERVILKAMSRRVAQRHPSAQELSNELRRLEGMTAIPKPVEQMIIVKWLKRKAMPAEAAIWVVLILLAVLAWKVRGCAVH